MARCRSCALLPLIAVSLLCLTRGAPAEATPFDSQTKILVHVAPVTSKNGCAAGSLSDCQSAVSSATLSTSAGPFYFAYVLVARGSLASISGVQFGIAYEGLQPGAINNGTGVDVFSWHLCATLEFQQPSPAWPQAGGGNLVTWQTPSACQVGETAVAGYFYMGAYSPDTLQVTNRPVDNVAKVANCPSNEFTLGKEDLGFAAFSAGATTPGCNPCLQNCPESRYPLPPPPPPPPPTADPRILLHVTVPVSKNACANGYLSDPANAVTKGQLATGSGPFYFAYLLVARERVPTIGGVQCGISYDHNQPGDIGNGSGIDVFGWVLCATLEFPSSGTNVWPQPGGGNLITWSETQCTANPVAVAGYFYMGAYSQDRLIVTPRPVDGAAKIAECDGAETPVAEERLGYAAFSSGGSVSGCNPWIQTCQDVVPVQNTTWGGVKAFFNR